MRTISELVDTRAEETPEKIFLQTPEVDKALSYGELRVHCQGIGERLAGLGLEKGDKVAFLMNNGQWTTMLFIGAMYSGRVIVPLNAVSGADQMRYVIKHSDAKVLFISDDYSEKYAKVLDEISHDLLIIRANEDTGADWPEDVVDADVIPPLPPVITDDEALLIYTSGTTGQPKGVLLSQANVIAGGANTAGAHGLTSDDSALCVLPLYHINAEMVTVMAPLVSGGTVVMPRRFSASEFWPLIETYRCTWFSVVPTIIAYLLDRAERLGHDHNNPGFKQLRFGRSASAPLSPDMHLQFEELFGLPIVETMGLTETSAQILSNPMPPAKPKYGSPGVAYGNEGKIIGTDGVELPDGESGELMIRGSNVMIGYYKNPEATHEALTVDGWLHTGDLAYRDSDGYFFITGRLKEIIIKGGENIAPREIDEALHQHPAVLEAAAYPVPDRNYGQEIMACVTLKPGAECSSHELEAFCVDKLGRYKAPKEISFLDSLPKGPSGKIQRMKLADAVAKAAS